MFIMIKSVFQSYHLVEKNVKSISKRPFICENHGLSKHGLISFVTELSFQETQVAVYQLPGQPWYHMGLHAANE